MGKQTPFVLKKFPFASGIIRLEADITVSRLPVGDTAVVKHGQFPCEGLVEHLALCQPEALLAAPHIIFKLLRISSRGFCRRIFLLRLKAQHIALEELQMFVNKVRGSLKSKQTVTCGHPNSRVLAREIQNIDKAAL